MVRPIKKYLDDILFSINAIDIHLQGSKDYAVFVHNLTMQRSVERELEIIGEAMNRILKLQPGIDITSAVKIVDQRNLIIHAYDSINNEMIWNVVTNYLPKLKEEVTLLLGETF